MDERDDTDDTGEPVTVMLGGQIIHGHTDASGAVVIDSAEDLRDTDGLDRGQDL